MPLKNAIENLMRTHLLLLDLKGLSPKDHGVVHISKIVKMHCKMQLREII